MQKESRAKGKVYRCLKASAVAYLTKIELLEKVKAVAKSQLNVKPGDLS